MLIAKPGYYFSFFYDSFSSKSLIYDKSQENVSRENVSNGLSYSIWVALCSLTLGVNNINPHAS